MAQRRCSRSGCTKAAGERTGLCRAHTDPPERDSEGWHVDSQGYRSRWVEVDGKRTKQREHRLVMERMLGRKLLPGENVHHRNGDRAYNAPENLELWVTMQPAGQRPQDLVAYASEIFARYGNGILPARNVAARG